MLDTEETRAAEYRRKESARVLWQAQNEVRLRGNPLAAQGLRARTMALIPPYETGAVDRNYTIGTEDNGDNDERNEQGVYRNDRYDYTQRR